MSNMEPPKTNPSCPICRAISGQDRAKKIYEDDKVVALLSDTPCTVGHVMVASKDHHPIIQEVPDPVVAHIFKVASKISSVVFEQLGAHGTNLLVRNGIPAGQEFAHFMVHVVPRRENDGLPIKWQPMEVSDEQLSTLELQLKEQASGMGAFEKEKQKPIEIKKEENVMAGDEDYRIRHLNRLP